MMEFEYPGAFIERVAGQLQDGMPGFLRALNEKPLRGIRFHSTKKCRLDEIEGIGEVIPWEKQARYLSLESNAGSLLWHEIGAYYIQEPSAMIPAKVMDAHPGEKILDLCAAPGGKSTQLAADLRGEGLLVSNEPVPKRAQILSRNMERMGVINSLVISAYPDQIAEQWPEGFDGVQTDAPCSGEGMFRRHPETRAEWTPENARGCAERQMQILDAAAKLVRPGGRIVYSTCTMNPQENEELVERFLSRHPEFEPEAFTLDGGICAPQGAIMIWPHLYKGEGQFVAKLRKKGDGEAILPENKSLRNTDPSEIRLIKDFEPDAPQVTGKLGNTYFSLAECPETGRLKVMRAGLHLGEARGKIFVPDHAWAIADKAPNIASVELDRLAAVRWLNGETAEGENRGWVTVRYDGLPIGWGKGSDGIIKNHYPRGLRKVLTSETE